MVVQQSEIMTRWWTLVLALSFLKYVLAQNMRDSSCPEIMVTNSADIIYTSEKRNLYSFAVIRCKSLYELVPSTAGLVQCQRDERWEIIPNCYERPLIHVPANGEKDCNTSRLAHGKSCRITCDTGYEVDVNGVRSDSIIIESFNGKITPAMNQITCREKPCNLDDYAGFLFSYKDGSIAQGLIESNTSLIVGCSHGQELIGDQQPVICKQGNINHITAVCQDKSCEPPPEGEHLRNIIKKQDERGKIVSGSSVDVVCDAGYEYRSGYTRETITCHQGNLMPRAQKCYPMKCEQPPLVNSRVEDELDRTERISSDVAIIVICNRGFELRSGGQRQIIVCQHGIFHPQPEPCVANLVQYRVRISSLNWKTTDLREFCIKVIGLNGMATECLKFTNWKRRYIHKYRHYVTLLDEQVDSVDVGKISSIQLSNTKWTADLIAIQRLGDVDIYVFKPTNEAKELYVTPSFISQFYEMSREIADKSCTEKRIGYWTSWLECELRCLDRTDCKYFGYRIAPVYDRCYINAVECNYDHAFTVKTKRVT